MRLIDADAFAEFLKDAVKRQKYDDLNIDGLLTVADVIEAIISELDGTSLARFKNAPTIEPERKKGKWLEMAGDLQCSECGATYHDLYPDYSDTKFCPNCGSYNGGENDQSK